MKKLLIVLLASGILTACNSGSSNNTTNNNTPDPVIPVPINAFQIQFVPEEITLKNGESQDVILQLYKYDDKMEYPDIESFIMTQSESGIVDIQPKICILNINHQCKLHITALTDNKSVYVYPIIPMEYNYIEVLDLIVHSESAE